MRKQTNTKINCKHHRGERVRPQKEQGITLIALVITIIVLLILAGVTIAMIVGDNGILTRAKEAKTATEEATIKEEIQIAHAGSFDENTGGYSVEKFKTEMEEKEYNIEGESWPITVSKNGKSYEVGENGEISSVVNENGEISVVNWTQNESEITNGTVTVKVGDKITYDPEIAAGTTVTLTTDETGYSSQTITLKDSELEWRILGVSEEGKILITPTEGVTSDWVYLKGQTGYANGIATLNKIAEYYGEGTGASGARSITVEDVNKVTGYNPETAQYGKGNIKEYGNEVTYSWQGTNYPYYEGSNGVTGSLDTSHSSGFNWYEDGWRYSAKSTTATTSAKELITKIKSSYYYYYPQSLTTSSTATSSGISTSSNEYTMLFENESYWLGSQYIYTSSSYVIFGLRNVWANYYVNGNLLGESYAGGYHCSKGVRPAVSLKSSVQLTGDSSSGWSIVEAE